MAPRVHTPVAGFTGTVAGVAFADGSGETDDVAALAYFQRKGYRVDGEDEKPDDAGESGAPGVKQEQAEHTVPPAGTPLTDEELARAAVSEAVGDQGGNPPDQYDDDKQEQAERPHPVQGSKAAWYEHLEKLNPDHGFDLEKVKRAELIAAVEAIEAKQG